MGWNDEKYSNRNKELEKEMAHLIVSMCNSLPLWLNAISQNSVTSAASWVGKCCSSLIDLLCVEAACLTLYFHPSGSVCHISLRPRCPLLCYKVSLWNTVFHYETTSWLVNSRAGAALGRKLVKSKQNLVLGKGVLGYNCIVNVGRGALKKDEFGKNKYALLIRVPTWICYSHNHVNLHQMTGKPPLTTASAVA